MTEGEAVARLLIHAAAVGCADLVLGPSTEHDQLNGNNILGHYGLQSVRLKRPGNSCLPPEIRRKPMSQGELIAVAFKDRTKARESLDEVHRLQREGLLDVDGAAVLEIDDNGRPLIHRPEVLADKGLIAGGVVGGVVGTLVGAMTMNPIIGGVLGVSIGSVSGAGAGALVDAGIEDGFLTDLAGQLEPESSALFVQVRTDDLDSSIRATKPMGGKVITTSLNPFDAENLQKALEGRLDDVMG